MGAGDHWPGGAAKWMDPRIQEVINTCTSEEGRDKEGKLCSLVFEALQLTFLLVKGAFSWHTALNLIAGGGVRLY